MINKIKNILLNPRKDADDFLLFLNKKIAYQKDVLREESLKEAESIRDELKRLIRERGKSQLVYKQELGELHLRAGKIFRSDSAESTREWVEVILVAAVIAISFKTYFFQPFKIPTNSMYPTLYGVVTVPLKSDVLPKSLPARILDLAIFGKVQHRLVVKKGGTILSIKPSHLLGIPFVDTTEIRVDREVYRVITTYRHFMSGTRGKVRTGMEVSAGDVLANFTSEIGDHLFVNKMAYHFRKPKQGEVFVFTTNGIWGIESRNRREGIHSGQFYIKRCVGVPGVTLKVEEPRLFSNGKLLTGSAFEKIYSKRNGYQGYTYGPNYLTGPSSILPLKKDQYWAMGDNSPNSLDSRFWGIVPRRNLVGTALIVYWPFSSRWGWIR